MRDNEITILPDGSAFTTASFPLPEDHWIYNTGGNPPPMPFRMGENTPLRKEMIAGVWEAGKHAIRGATMNGKDDDFDPDALIQNLIVGMFGYFTEDGTCGDSGGDPKNIPPLWNKENEE